MPGKKMNGPPVASPRKGAGDSGFATFDPDDPDYVRDLQRPAVIKEDMNEMERRKRVREILESKPFRTELEQLILQEKEKGNNPDNLKTLEQLSELIMPRGQLTAATLHGMSSQAIVPISDLRGGDATKYSKQERILRNKLAALYRLLDLFQWSQGIYNHVTLRLHPDTDEFLINPFGLLYHEINASSLIKVDGNGEIMDGGSTGMGINEAGFVLHSTVHRARPTARCVIHLHTPVVGAVAAMKCGLLPICQEAMIVGPVSYHDFQGIVNDPSERESIISDLNQNPDSKVMLLRNHGFVAIGSTVEEAFHLAFHTIMAAETQVIFLRGDGFVVIGESVEDAFHLTRSLIQASEQQIRAARAGIENLVIPSEEAQRKCFETANQGGGGVLKSPSNGPDGKQGIKWRVGELEWEAWMRVLDNAGFRTGHLYRQPLLRSKALMAGSPQSEVEVPPAASSYGLLDEADASTAATQRLEAMRRDQEKTRWLNSPNVYQKVEFLESGTADPKKITKWVQDATSPVHSTPVKITDSTHQFSPMSINSKEFKDKQKAIKEQRRAGGVSAGPRSHVLEGVTYEDLSIKDADLSGASDRIVTIGTASKGIIERDFQHNAQVYRQLYAPNPFASETDEDIQKYMSEVQLKKGTVPHGDKPGSPAETESPSAETVSLMMAARDHRPVQAVDEEPPLPQPTATTKTSGKGWTRETTFDPRTNQTTSRITEKKQPSSIGGWFQRSKSARFNRTHESPVRAGDAKAASDDEVQAEGKSPKKKEKKKKFKAPSFLRSKKDKKKQKEGVSDGEEEE